MKQSFIERRRVAISANHRSPRTSQVFSVPVNLLYKTQCNAPPPPCRASGLRCNLHCCCCTFFFAGVFFLSLSSKQHLFFYITRELTLMMHETEREMGTETASSLEPRGRRSRARAFNNYQNSRDGVSHFIPNLGRGGEPFSKFERGRGFTAIDFPINYQSHPSGICSTSPRVSDLLSFCTLAVLFFL